MANLDSFANKTEQDFQLTYKGELETVKSWPWNHNASTGKNNIYN